MIRNWDEEYFDVPPSYKLFLRGFGELDVLHEEQIVDDSLDGYEVLLKSGSGLPASSHHKVGSGRVFLPGSCVRDTCFQGWHDRDSRARAELRGLISAITASCGIRPRVWSTNPRIEAAVIWHFSTTDDGRPEDYLATRPGHPFVRRTTTMATAS